MIIKSLVFRINWLLLILLTLTLTFLLMHHPTLLLLPFSHFFQLLCLDNNMIQSKRLDFRIIDIIGSITITAKGSHAGNYHQEHPSVSEVRCNFLYLNLIEFAYALMQALLDETFEDLLPSSVLFDELGRVFRTIQSQ